MRAVLLAAVLEVEATDPGIRFVDAHLFDAPPERVADEPVHHDPEAFRRAATRTDRRL